MTTEQIETIVSPLSEEFLPVPGYEGLYEVSNLGRVRSVDRFIERTNRWGTPYMAFYPSIELKQKVDKYGYLTVCIFRNTKRNYTTVHRLVASAFIPNPDNLPQVNHKNCNKKDNSVNNIEWITNIDNRRHAIENNLQRYAKGEQRSTLKEYQVREMKRLLSEGVMTQIAIARKFGVGKNTVYHIAKGNTWRTV